MADLALTVDLTDARDNISDAADAVDDGASAAVRQLAVLAEGAMKKEVPEGSGEDVHTRDTIDTRFSRDGKRANVGARKRTDDGDLLARIIVEGTDGSSYDPSPGLVAFLGRQIEPWAAAKLGDPSLAYPVAWTIVRDGHQTFPNPFVDRSLRAWRDQVRDVTTERVQDALDAALTGAGGP